MKTLAKLQGRRVAVASENLSEWQAGDYWKDADDGSWHGVTPDGGFAWFKSHHVEEHEDGTISTRKARGDRTRSCAAAENLNGTVTTWHGCIERGIWKEF